MSFQFHSIRSLIMLFLFIAYNDYQAQFLPDWGTAFPQNEVTTVNITIDADSLEQMIATQDNEHYYPASFSYTSMASTLSFDTVGFRLKGRTSLGAQKLSFKISTDEFQNNELSEGMNIMNLVAQHNDPSIIRSKLCHDFYRAYDIPSARTAYTRLYINGEYRGVYLNVEQIDEAFAEKYFHAPGDGNIYKCGYPADLDYISNNPNDYKLMPDWSTVRTYDLKTNNSLDDYSGFAHFIDVLVNTSTQNLACELPKVFNVESYLKVMAIDVLTGNWDGYAYNKNNYYLYHNPQTGQFNFIPYDLDNTFGMDWLGLDWGVRNVYGWANSGEDRPLFKRLLQVPAFRDRFSYHLDRMMLEYFNEAAISTLAVSWQNLIEAAAEEDTFRTLDYGFDLDDFYASLNSAELGDQDEWHLPYGILPYVNARRANAISQLENYDSQSAFVHWVKQRPISGAVLIEARIEGPQSQSCQIKYSTDGVNFNTSIFTDVYGLSQTANDGIFSFILPEPMTASDKYFYQVILPDGSLFPCTPSFFWLTNSSPGLFINEVMPLNNTTIMDEAGAYEDWVELYNGTNSSINLSGKFLSDDSISWYKFPLPSITIPAHGFKLIWLDKDHGQGPLHATFKLSPTETIYLTSLQDLQPRATGRMSNLPNLADVSLALTVDGGYESGYTSETTPEFSNVITGVNKEEVQSIIYSYPNPGNDFIRFNAQVTEVELRDATGRLVGKDSHSVGINTRSVASGVYFLKLDNTIVRQIIQH